MRIQRCKRLRQHLRLKPIVGQMVFPVRLILLHAGADNLPQSRLCMRQPQEHMQRDDIEFRISRAKHGSKSCGQFRQIWPRQIPARHMAQRINQHEPIFVPRLLECIQKRLHKRPCLLFLAGSEQTLADGLKRVGNAQRMLAGDAVIRVQTEADIMRPQFSGLRQKRHHGGRHLAILGRKRPLLAVARTGIRKDFSHDAPRDTPHVAVRVHEQFIQEYKRFPLVGPRHIGAVFLQQTQVHADTLEILFALGLLEQLLERLVSRKRVHEADGAVQRQITQCPNRLLRIHE